MSKLSFQCKLTEFAWDAIAMQCKHSLLASAVAPCAPLLHGGMGASTIGGSCKAHSPPHLLSPTPLSRKQPNGHAAPMLVLGVLGPSPPWSSMWSSMELGNGRLLSGNCNDVVAFCVARPRFAAPNPVWPHWGHGGAPVASPVQALARNPKQLSMNLM